MENEVVTGASGPDDVLYLFTLSVIALVMVLEVFWPRRKMQSNLFWRWSNNFSLSMLTWYVSSIFTAALVLYLVDLNEAWKVGLLPILGGGPLLSFGILLVVSEFTNYLIHVAFHKAPWLWPFHAMHHADVDVDVSTSFRHHPLEPLISLPFAVPIVLSLGVSLEVAVAHRLFVIAAQVFSHSNIRLPEGLEKRLRTVILTPDFHRLHHCAEARFTNTNYGTVLPWFDYLFGTASSRPFNEQTTMEIGLEYLREPRDNRLDRIITAPFRWRQSTHVDAAGDG